MDNKERVAIATRVFARHGPGIRTMIQRHSRSADEAEDIYQNLYLTLVRSAPSCPSENVLAYLDTVIRHDVIDAVRRRRKREEVVSRYTSGLTSGTEQSPEETAIREEQLQQIRACIRSLPEHEAKVLIERLENGRNTAETAEQMHIKGRTVSRYLSVGLSRIRNALAKGEVENGFCR